MTKDEYILKVLNKVEWLREPATHIKSLLQENRLSPEYKEYLYNHFTTSIHNAVVKKREEQQQHLLKNIDTLKFKEEEEKSANDNEVNNLENLLETMY